MEIIEVLINDSSSDNVKLKNIILQFTNLLTLLRSQPLPEDTIERINIELAPINTSELNGSAFGKLIKQKQAVILKILEKDLKIVPKNYYRNLWTLLGMTAFGLPLGVILGLSLGNIGLLGIGLPFGLGLGALLGANMDKKAAAEGRQLDIELKY